MPFDGASNQFLCSWESDLARWILVMHPPYSIHLMIWRETIPSNWKNNNNLMIRYPLLSLDWGATGALAWTGTWELVTEIPCSQAGILSVFGVLPTCGAPLVTTEITTSLGEVLWHWTDFWLSYWVVVQPVSLLFFSYFMRNISL